MTDYIAFDENNIAYSIYDIEKSEDIKKSNLYCICGEKVFFRKNSVVYEDRLGRIRQNISHFSHFKNTKCNIIQIMKQDKERAKNGDAPLLTDEEKRIKRIKKIMKYIKKSTDIYFLYKNEINQVIKKSNDHNLEYIQYMTPL